VELLVGPFLLSVPVVGWMATKNRGQSDDLFLAIARHHDGIEGLIDSFFGFLERKTDFFHVITPQSDGKMGFLPGAALTMVVSAFEANAARYRQRKGQKEETARKTPQKVSPSDPSPGIRTDGGGTDHSTPVASSSASPSRESAKSKGDGTCRDDEQRPQSETSFPSHRVASQDNSSVTTTATARSSGSMELRSDPLVEQPSSATLGLKKSTRNGVGNSIVEHNRHISTWNGGATERYMWSQSIKEVTMEIPLKESRKASELVVEITSTQLRASVKETGEVLLAGDFPERVSRGDSIWSVEDNDKLLVTLDKMKEIWWKSVFVGDTEIDCTKVDSTKSVQDYDPETQGAIRKIIFDRDQKAKGLPSSNQIRTGEIIRQAWDAENSPFKGTPFDPSVLNIQGDLPSDL